MKKLTLASALLVLSCATALAADPVRGRQVYEKVGCYQCHGWQGQGANTGPKLAPQPMAADALASFIRNSQETLMPAYSADLVSDRDVADIHAYLVSIKPPPAAKDLPLLMQR
jgi:mono/diheme cytochrome c family protein